MDKWMQRPGAGLEKIMALSLRKVPAGQSPVLAWPLACGSEVAVRTRAIDFSQGVLRIEVRDTGWQLELQALAPRYLASIQHYTLEKVMRLEFVVLQEPRRSNRIDSSLGKADEGH